MKMPFFFAVFVLAFSAVSGIAAEEAMSRAQAVRALDDALRLAGEERHEEAVSTFEKVRVENPDAIESIHGLKIAVVLAVLGDAQKHEAHCRWLMERYCDATTATDAERSVKGYLVVPGADNKELLAQAARMTRLAVDIAADAGEDDLLPWFYVSHGVAEYRMGNYADAAKWLSKSAGDENIYIRGLALSFNALSEHGQGNHAAAAELLEKAGTTAAKLPKPGSAEYAKEWTDTLITGLALAEAEGALAP